MKAKSHKKLKIIISIVLILVVGLFVLFEVDSRNRTEKKINANFTTLLKSLSYSDCDKIRNNLADKDGKKLDDEQIKNYIVNSGFYRKIYTKSEEIYTKVSVGFLNTDEGTVDFSFNTLDGNKVAGTLKYVHKGAHEYFIAEDNLINSLNKEYKKVPLTVEGADFSKFKLSFDDSEDDDSTEDDSIELDDYYIDKISSGKYEFCYYKEAEGDLKAYLADSLYAEKRKLDDNDSSEYTINFDDKFTQINLYAKNPKDVKLDALDLVTLLYMMRTEVCIQLINGNEDWHLALNVYSADGKDKAGQWKIR